MCMLKIKCSVQDVWKNQPNYYMLRHMIIRLILPNVHPNVVHKIIYIYFTNKVFMDMCVFHKQGIYKHIYIL